MKINAQLDVDVVALQQDDEVTCLLTLDAPVPAASDSRPGESLVVVVDRSGSMAGAPLESVRQSLHALIDRVRPQDTFGVVTFDDTAAVAIPARAMRDHHTPTVHALVDGIVSGGTTDLSGGYLLGLSEARRHLGATGATVLLLSDGQANSGITDPLQVGALSAQARTEHITTGTIGIGEGYDETLLAEISRQGNGPHRFAFTPDDAAAVIAEEAGDLLSKSAINAFVRITPADEELIEHITVMHDLPTWLEAGPTGEKVIVVALGDLYAGEHRELLLQFGVPSVDALGLRDLATLTIDYVALPALEAHSVTWPVAVNVVPGEEAAGRVPDPSVHVARLLVAANEAKKQASDDLKRGDGESAAGVMGAQADILDRERTALLDSPDPAPAGLIERLATESAQARRLADSARERTANLALKSMTEDVMTGSQGRNDPTRLSRNRSKRDF